MSSLLDTIRALVQQIVAPLDLYARYPAQVVGQNADGSLELKPLHKRLGGLSRVPIRYGVPGVRAKVRQGSLVLVGFEAGDERYPFATDFASDAIDELTITASAKVIVKAPQIFLGDEEGAQPLARVGDLVEVALPPETPFAGTFPGGPISGLITFVDTAQGYITSGSDRTKGK